MKTLIPFLILFFSAQISFAQTTQIPDPIFEQILIDWGLDSGTPDGLVNTASIDTVTFLTVQGADISDLTGIENFTALQELNCSFNQLSNLDVSQNTALVHLNCRSNNLTSIDISQNVILREFSCIYNPISILNVSNNPALEVLLCENTDISTLDVSQNFNLRTLRCSYTNLTELDISQNTVLEEFHYTKTSIGNMDFSQNSQIKHLHCRDSEVSHIELSDLPQLTTLFCEENQLTYMSFAQNPLLTELYCTDNLLTGLDLIYNPELTKLNCSFNQLTCLDLDNGHNTLITSFNAVSNTNLYCIQVDNANWAAGQWTSIDPNSSFDEQCNCIVGTNNFDQPLPNLHVSPNPNHGAITIQIGDIRDQITVNLLSSIGQLISTKVFENTDLIDMNVDVPQGIYFLEISSDLGESETVRIIIN